MSATTPNMTKADLIEEVSRLAELTRKDSEMIVETVFDSIVRSLRAGDKIEIRGFGSFRTRQRKPRVGRNPKTGERVDVPSKTIPFFKPSKELRDSVNTGRAASVPAATPPVSCNLQIRLSGLPSIFQRRPDTDRPPSGPGQRRLHPPGSPAQLP